MRDEAAPEVEALRNVPFFEDLTTEDLERMATIGQTWRSHIRGGCGQPEHKDVDSR